MNETKKPMLAEDAIEDKIKFPTIAQTKTDGCFSYGTLVQTSAGLKKIGDIVKNKLKVKVLSYNDATQQLEYKKVINWFDNGKKTGYGFCTNGMVTNNHKFFSTSKGWFPLNEQETISKIDNKYLNSMLVGMLLGDESLTIEKRNRGKGWCDLQQKAKSLDC